jgi:sec-independent protein translocase protein TatA
VPFGLGIWEIVILAGILVLLFGAKGAPGMARRLGSGVKEMKDAVTELDPRSILDPKDKPAEAPPRPLEASKAVPVTAAPVAPAPVAVVPEAVPAEAVPAEAVPVEPPTQEAVPPEGESPSA